MRRRNAVPELPWTSSAAQREAQLLQAKAAGRRCVLYIYESPDASTFRYRVYNVCRAMEQTQDLFGTWFYAQTEQDSIRRMLPECTCLVICRVRWIPFVDELVFRARRLGKKLLFDIDDLIFDTARIPEIVNVLGVDLRTGGEEKLQFWFSFAARNALTASYADAFVTTVEPLGRRLQDLFGKEYTVLPNTLNEEQLAVSQRAMEEPSRGPFTLGYFSGSETHFNDLMVCVPEVQAFLQRHPDTRLRIQGWMDLPEQLRGLYHAGRIELAPLVDFRRLQQCMAQADVSLVPLQDGIYADCKSELKYFEAAAVETLTVASPSYAYAKAIRQGETGLLCRPGHWLEQLEWVYDHREEAGRIAKAAREECLDIYGPASLIPRVEALFSGF